MIPKPMKRPTVELKVEAVKGQRIQAKANTSAATPDAFSNEVNIRMTSLRPNGELEQPPTAPAKATRAHNVLQRQRGLSTYLSRPLQALVRRQ